MKVLCSAWLALMVTAGCGSVRENKKLNENAKPIETAAPTPTPDQITLVSSIALGHQDANTLTGLKNGVSAPNFVHAVNGKLIVSDANNNRVLIWNAVPTTAGVPPDVVLGQPGFGSVTANYGGLSAKSLSAPRGVSSDGTKLFVVDQGNSRILGWNQIPTTNYQAADFVLGQQDLASNKNLELGLYEASYAEEIGSKLVVLDVLNNRVLIWNSFPTNSTTPPSVVLGQPDLYTTTANTYGISASTVNGPSSVTSCNGKFIITDASNNRVLIWNNFPTQSGTPADVVLGQPNFFSSTANNGGVSAKSLSNPAHIFCDPNGRLLLADANNARVLIWNSVPTTSFAAADLVLGQTDFTTNTVNQGGLGAGTLNTSVSGAWSNGTKLVVSDQSNHRLLIWNTFPTVNKQAADLVMGQTNLTSNTANSGGLSASSLNSPNGFAYDGTRYWVRDAANARLLGFNSFPTANKPSADVVLGQPNFGVNTANNGGLSAASMSSAGRISAVGGRLVYADRYNNRIMIWSTSPSVNFTDANLILGQTAGSTNISNTPIVSSTSVSSPSDIAARNGKLIVADNKNNRVLIWSSIPSLTNTPADIVVGQANMTTNEANGGGISAATLNTPYGVHYDGTRLFVADGNNHRVLIWNALPSANGQAANLELGQPNMTSSTANNGGIAAISLNTPTQAITVGSKLIVSDNGNHRLLVWNSIPAVDRAPADLVIGQPNLTSNTANNGGISAARLNAPQRMASDGTKLMIGDGTNNRVLIFNTVPTASSTSADTVVGQPDMISSTLNNPGALASPRIFRNLASASSNGTRLAATDMSNHRILLWNSIPTSNDQAPDLVLGQANMTDSSGNAGLGAPTAQTLFQLTGAFWNNNKLFATDLSNRRVLIWNNPPTINQQAADVVVGFGAMTTNTYGGPNGSSFQSPSRTIVANNKLLVVDRDDHRVLIWNSVPTSNGATADLILGQPNFTGVTANNGGISAATMNKPFGIAVAGQKIIVTEQNNNRVLIWNSWPTASGQAADIVLGQPDFTSNVANNGGLSAKSLSGPCGAWTDGTRLLIVDTNNNRILVWNSIPTNNQQPADRVIGQRFFTTNSDFNILGATGNTLKQPMDVMSDGTRLIISDFANNRVLISPVPWATTP